MGSLGGLNIYWLIIEPALAVYVDFLRLKRCLFQFATNLSGDLLARILLLYIK